MKMASWLRAAAVLTLVVALGHTSGGIDRWSPPGDTDVLRSMASFHFDAVGSNRSYLDFYLDFGYVVSLYLFAQAALLWQLASMGSVPGLQVRSMVAIFIAVNVVTTAFACAWLFVIPVVCNLLISICLAFAWFAAKREPSV